MIHQRSVGTDARTAPTRATRSSTVFAVRVARDRLRGGPNAERQSSGVFPETPHGPTSPPTHPEPDAHSACASTLRRAIRVRRTPSRRCGRRHPSRPKQQPKSPADFVEVRRRWPHRQTSTHPPGDPGRGERARCIHGPLHADNQQGNVHYLCVAKAPRLQRSTARRRPPTRGREGSRASPRGEGCGASDEVSSLVRAVHG